MKKTFCFAVLLMACLLTISAFAAEKTIHLRNTTEIAGQTLAAGEYTMKYELQGTTTKVHFLQDKKKVASVSGHVVEMSMPPKDDAVVLKSNGDGTLKLLELQFAGKKSAIKFGSEQIQGN